MTMKRKSVFSFTLFPSVALMALAACGIGGCSHAGSAGPQSAGSTGLGRDGASVSSGGAQASRAASEHEDRATARLGTRWGERLDDHITRTVFERDVAEPDGAVAIYYNDASGLRSAGVDPKSGQFTRRPIPLLSGAVAVGVTDEEGVFGSRYLPSGRFHGKNFVRGYRDKRFGIEIANNTDQRVEVVCSVDGLDIMNGRPASIDNRGYIFAPGETATLQGFRSSLDEVHAFRFSGLDASYAERKYGDTSQAGVIGCAFFREEGSEKLARNFTDRHHHRGENWLEAEPFRHEFATAPDEE